MTTSSDGWQRLRRDRCRTTRRRRTPTTAATGIDVAGTEHPPPQHHRLGRRGRGRMPRPVSVWPCATGSAPADGHGLGWVGQWLLTAIVKIVTCYTVPGQRVLLVGAADLADPTGPAHAGVPRPVRPGPLSGLTETAWTVLRLGRGVRTQLVGPTLADPEPVFTTPARTAAHPVGSHPDRAAESGSGPGPVLLDSPWTAESGAGPDHPDPDRRRTGEAGGTRSAERYDLIVIAVPPTSTGWLRPTEWAPLLAPTGALTVITHGHHPKGRLTDPVAALVSAATRTGLSLLDRIALLTTPAPDLPATGHLRTRTGAIATAQHADLLVFTRFPNPAPSPAQNTAAPSSQDGDLR